MTHFYATAIDPAEQRDLATAFAWSMAHTVANDELPFFNDVAADYWTDPSGAMRSDGNGEPVGFGIDAAMTTTILLAVATPVIDYLAIELCTTVKERVTPKVTAWIRRILGVGPATPEPVPTLSPDQLGMVRSVTRDQAMRFGMAATDAELLADAIVGATVMAAART